MEQNPPPLLNDRFSAETQPSTKSVSTLYSQIPELLLKVDCLDFDIMAFRDATEGNELFSLLHYFASVADFQSTLNLSLSRLRTFSISV